MADGKYLTDGSHQTRLKIFQGRNSYWLETAVNNWLMWNPRVVVTSFQMDRPGVEYVLYALYTGEEGGG